MSHHQQMIRIGGASGFWGDASLATAQLLAEGGLDFIVYDYLAEITMAILGRMRARDPRLGYATDFVTQAMAPNLAEIARQGVRIIANAGGVNPQACAEALRAEIAKAGLSLKIATISGDDLMPQIDEIAKAAPVEMFSRTAFPELAKIGSANAYLGAFPIAKALSDGADIVITGRCVDSAVTLGAAIHAFGWHDLDLLAAGSLAGHLIECGTQVTGGNFTDWRGVSDSHAPMGYPIVEISADGLMSVTKPAKTAGLVSKATVAEQLVYEIGDPQAYILPDVTCDFSDVLLVETARNRVNVSGARGFAAPSHYKACVTWHDGFRGGHLFGYYGIEAEEKAGVFARLALERTQAVLSGMNAPPLSETSVEILGSESQFGAARQSGPAREVNVKIAVRHPDAKGVAVFLKEATGLALSVPPGLSGFAGARPKPSPVLALFSFLLPKTAVKITISDQQGARIFVPETATLSPNLPARPPAPKAPVIGAGLIETPLIRLAWGRSGDKGDSANIGLIARHTVALPYIWQAVDETLIRACFGHFLDGEITRYLLPGLDAINIVMTNVLGGGGTTSLRNDPQGKGYAQLLLAQTIKVPPAILELIE